MAPDLSDLIQIVGGGGLVIGATVGFALRAENDRKLVENITLGGGLGGIAGTAVAFVIWLSAKAAGA